MGERVDGCLVQPRAAGDTELTAACEGGSNFEGCAQKNTCEAWMKYGRKVVEETRETFVDGIMDSTSLMNFHETTSPEEFRKAAHILLDLAVDQYESDSLDAEVTYGG